MENLVGYGKDDLLRPLLLEHALEQGVTIDESVVTAKVLADLPAANRHAANWCVEVNANVHSETCAVRAVRLQRERELLTPLPSLRPSMGPPPVTRKVDRLSTIRLGSARYSVPVRLRGASVAVVVDGPRVIILAEHPLVAPGEASVLDEHYGGPRPAVPIRAIRPRTRAEKDFCALGPAAEAVIAGAAAAGHTRLGPSWPN